MKRLLLTTAATVLMTQVAFADAFTDRIVENLRDLGYEFIEIRTGPTQVKAEGIRGSEKIEIVFDRATGEILKQETERADAGEIGRTGVQIDTDDDDFLDDDDHDEDRDHHGGDDDDDDDHDDDHDDEDHDDDDHDEDDHEDEDHSGRDHDGDDD